MLLIRLLDWYAQRNLPAPISGLLRYHGGWLSAREMKEWRKREGAIEQERRNQQKPAEHHAGLAISMIDTITTQQPGQQEPTRLRGGRNQAFQKYMHRIGPTTPNG